VLTDNALSELKRRAYLLLTKQNAFHQAGRDALDITVQ
jgi:hypothetical protein